MATRVLSETLLCRLDRTGEGSDGTSVSLAWGLGAPLPTTSCNAHRGWGTPTGWAQVAAQCLLVILIQLYPKLRGGERKKARGHTDAGGSAVALRPDQDSPRIGQHPCPWLRGFLEPELQLQSWTKDSERARL